MNKALLTGAALILVGCLAYTPALTQEQKEEATSAATAETTNAPTAEPKSAASPKTTGAITAEPKSAAAPETKTDAGPAKKPSGTHGAPSRSVAARTALCKADCRPNNYKDCGSWGCTGMHGLYRSYNSNDPQLKSIDGQKQYAQCVKACVDPLPAIYVQRPLLENGGSWFGKTASDCLACHADGPYLRVSGSGGKKK
jgi:hypothetical protein